MEIPVHELLYKKGLLEERASKSKIDWPNLTFYAHAAGEPLQNFTVVTAIAHYQYLAYEKAGELVQYKEDDVQWWNDIQQKADEIMDSGELYVQEMVQVSEDYNVLVVLDEVEVSDASMDRALELLEQSETPGTTFFGDRITFTSQNCVDHTRIIEERKQYASSH